MHDDSWLTMAALPRPVLPSLEDALAHAGRTLPEPLDFSEVRTTDHMATCRWGEAAVGLTLVERPVPKSLLEGPCSNAWYWPDAAEVLEGHAAHLLINVVDESRDAINKALRLTWLTSAVAQASRAVAILWAPAGLVHEPHAFDEQARQSSRDSLPLYLWIDFRVRQHEPSHTGTTAPPALSLFTTGLARFGKREIEMPAVDAPPQQVLQWAYNLAHYQLDKPTTIKDGDTIGLADGKEFTVRHATSSVDGQTPVLLLNESDPQA